jgi:hypothetical protein
VPFDQLPHHVRIYLQLFQEKAQKSADTQTQVVDSSPVQRKGDHCIDHFLDKGIIIRKLDKWYKRQQKPGGGMQNITWGV